MAEIEITLHGHYTARCACYGRSVTRKKHGVVDTLCRELLAAGASPDAEVIVTRNGTRCFNPATVGQWAKRRLVENDETGFRSMRYKPYDVSLDASDG